MKKIDVKTIPQVNLKFFLYLLDNPGMGYILGGEAALAPTKSMHELGLLKRVDKVKKSLYEYGSYWKLEKTAFTDEIFEEMLKRVGGN